MGICVSSMIGNITIKQINTLEGYTQGTVRASINLNDPRSLSQELSGNAIMQDAIPSTTPNSYTNSYGSVAMANVTDTTSTVTISLTTPGTYELTYDFGCFITDTKSGDSSKKIATESLNVTLVGGGKTITDSLKLVKGFLVPPNGATLDSTYNNATGIYSGKIINGLHTIIVGSNGADSKMDSLVSSNGTDIPVGSSVTDSLVSSNGTDIAVGSSVTIKYNVPEKITFVKCFPAGTPVRTPTGDKPIETIQEGDLVTTADGRHVPVKLAHRSLVRNANRSNAPYFIPANSLGANLPRNDLIMSPNHMLYIGNDQWLPAWKCKYRSSHVRQIRIGETFMYYNLGLLNYFTDNLLVNGVEVESMSTRNLVLDKSTNAFRRQHVSKS